MLIRFLILYPLIIGIFGLFNSIAIAENLEDDQESIIDPMLS